MSRFLRSIADQETWPAVCLILDHSVPVQRLRLTALPFETVHVTTAVRDAVVERLYRTARLPRGVVDFALAGGGFSDSAYGANLNLGLLLTAGHSAAFCDDDILARTYQRREVLAVDSVSLCGPGDPTCITVHPGAIPADALVSSSRPLLDVHATVVGQSIGRVLGEGAAGSLALGGEPIGKLTDLRALSRATVRLSVLGVAGDCGMEFLNNYVHLPASDAWPGDRNGYKRFRYSRSVIRASNEVALSPSGFLMNAAMAIDNTDPSLPFLPCFRNMDGLYSQMLLTCSPEDYVACLPYVVMHRPTSVRKHLRADEERAIGIRVSDWLMELTLSTPMPDGMESSGERMMCFGRAVAQMAELPERAFKRLVIDVAFRVLSKRAVLLSARLESVPGSSSQLYEDVSRQLRLTVQAAQSGFSGFTDFRSDASLAETYSSFKCFLRQWSELLQSWPTLWEAACDLELCEVFRRVDRHDDRHAKAN